jgi:hypothetical protein
MICRPVFASLRLRVSNQPDLHRLPLRTFGLAFASGHLVCSVLVCAGALKECVLIKSK